MIQHKTNALLAAGLTAFSWARMDRKIPQILDKNPELAEAGFWDVFGTKYMEAYLWIHEPVLAAVSCFILVFIAAAILDIIFLK